VRCATIFLSAVVLSGMCTVSRAQIATPHSSDALSPGVGYDSLRGEIRGTNNLSKPVLTPGRVAARACDFHVR
jgi:hypothetical protein